MLSFPTDGQGHDSKEDWTKFCRDIRGQNLVQLSLLSFPTGNQAERTGPNFARTLAGKIWSNPLFPTGGGGGVRVGWAGLGAGLRDCPGSGGWGLGLGWAWRGLGQFGSLGGGDRAGLWGRSWGWAGGAGG